MLGHTIYPSSVRLFSTTIYFTMNNSVPSSDIIPVFTFLRHSLSSSDVTIYMTVSKRKLRGRLYTLRRTSPNTINSGNLVSSVHDTSPTNRILLWCNVVSMLQVVSTIQWVETLWSAHGLHATHSCSITSSASAFSIRVFCSKVCFRKL